MLTIERQLGEPRNARRVADLVKLYINVSLGDRVIPSVPTQDPILTDARTGGNRVLDR